MSTSASIRQKLHSYLEVADDKKLHAIYNLLENEIEETRKWWKDNVFVVELEKSYKAWDTGKEKGYSLAEVEASIDQFKKKRNAK